MSLRFPLLCLTGTLYAMTAGAEILFTEQFEYGPTVPGRESIKEGDLVKKNDLLASNKVPWQTPGKNGMAFAPGKGISPAKGASNASIYIDVDPEIFSKGAPVCLQLDVTPGEAWVNSSGIRGIWLGFVNMTGKELLANVNELADHLVVRYAISPNFSESRIDVESGVQGHPTTITGPNLPSQPGATYQMQITYNPGDCSFEASITEKESGATQVVANILPQAPNFNVMRVDFTAIDTTKAPLPVIHKLSLEK